MSELRNPSTSREELAWYNREMLENSGFAYEREEEEKATES
jgi:hypothetical protein